MNIFEQILGAFERLRENGVRTVECDRALLDMRTMSSTASTSNLMRAAEDVRPYQSSTVSSSNLQTSTSRQAVISPVAGSTKIVPPVTGGTAAVPSAITLKPIVFVGETEDDFTGPGGTLFDKIIGAMHLTRDEVTCLTMGSVPGELSGTKAVVLFGKGTWGIFPEKQTLLRGIIVKNGGICYAPAIGMHALATMPDGSTAQKMRKRELWAMLKDLMKMTGVGHA